MNVIESALEKLYSRGPAAFSSKLFDTDCVTTTVQRNKICRSTITKYSISEALARQIIIRHCMKFFDKIVAGYKPVDKDNSPKGIFGAEKKASDAKLLHDIIVYSERVFECKQDTRVLDLKIAKAAKMLVEHVSWENLTSFGIDFCKVCNDIKPLREKEEMFLKNLVIDCNRVVAGSKSANKGSSL